MHLRGHLTGAPRLHLFFKGNKSFADQYIRRIKKKREYKKKSPRDQPCTTTTYYTTKHPARRPSQRWRLGTTKKNATHEGKKTQIPTLKKQTAPSWTQEKEVRKPRSIGLWPNGIVVYHLSTSKWLVSVVRLLLESSSVALFPDISPKVDQWSHQNFPFVLYVHLSSASAPVIMQGPCSV